MRIKYYLELDVEDEQTINHLQAISDAERTTLDEALRNMLQFFFKEGGDTPPPNKVAARLRDTAAKIQK